MRRLALVAAVLAATVGLAAVASATGPNGQRRPTLSQFQLHGRSVPSTGGSPTTTTTTTPSAPSDANCENTLPLGLTGIWQCTFDEEFNGTALNTNTWVVQQTASSGFTTGQGSVVACYVDSPDTVSESGGVLNLTAVQLPSATTCSDPAGNFSTAYEAGMVSTSGLFDQTDGAFEVNAKLPPAIVQGLQETFWLYPQKLTYGPWPASGEIDLAEFYSEFPNLDVPFIHYDAAQPDVNDTTDSCVIADPAGFNTYGVAWTSSSLTILLNGTVCLVDHWDPASPLTAPQPFDQPFFIALTQALGVTTNAFEPGATPLPATTSIDWVRAWR